MKNSKIYFLALFLFLCFFAFGQQQKTNYTIKTINKERQIVGYLIVTVLNNKVIKTERIDSYQELEALNLRKKAKATVYLKDIPNEKLNPGEYLKNGVKKF